MKDSTLDTGPALFTVGHSNHAPEEFLGLLSRHQIGTIVDVRSSPFSGYAPHFNKGPLESYMKASGVGYLFLGDRLGGRPEGDEFYDREGYVLYGRLAGSPRFQEAIEQLLTVVEQGRAALLCGEEDPTHCHRRLLVGRVAKDRGVRLLHLRGDGRIQSDEELAAEEDFHKTKGQMSLFEKQEPREWKSTQSVLPKRPQPNSSSFSGNPVSSD